MKGKLIVVEGTDCSGKETQTNLLFEKLVNENIEVYKTSFPMYDTPTGKIIGGPYLGKQYIGDGWFSEGASNVDPKVAALYFAADRKYNIGKINDMLDKGISVILDRYVYSNMAHQGGKMLDDKERLNMYAWLDILEFKLLDLPKPDIALFLHMPYECAIELKEHRSESSDQHENNPEHLKHAEKAYIELAQNYKWKTIECAYNNQVRSIEDINNEVYIYVIDKIKNS